jgi:hypothetical protein
VPWTDLITTSMLITSFTAQNHFILVRVVDVETASDVKRDGYSRSLVCRVLRGEATLAYGLDWEYADNAAT